MGRKKKSTATQLTDHAFTKYPCLSKPLDVETQLLNEFALMYEVRFRFPLHYVVFKQVS